MSVIERAGGLRYRLLHYLNRRELAACGADSLVGGRVERHHPASIIRVGCGCLIQGRLTTETEHSTITIGDNVFIGGRSSIDCAISVEIGDDVLVSYECIIMDSNNHSLRFSIRRGDNAEWKNGRRHDWTTTDSKAVKICRGAWVGARSVILKGVTVGEGAVIAAASVVTEEVRPWTIVGGNPARVIRELGPDER